MDHGDSTPCPIMTAGTSCSGLQTRDRGARSWAVRPSSRRNGRAKGSSTSCMCVVISKILATSGLVEHAGQGMNMIYEECIKEAKALPDYSQSDGYLVRIAHPYDRRQLQLREGAHRRLEGDDIVIQKVTWRDKPRPTPSADGTAWRRIHSSPAAPGGSRIQISRRSL